MSCSAVAVTVIIQMAPPSSLYIYIYIHMYTHIPKKKTEIITKTVPKANQQQRNVLQDCLFLICQMLAISIEKQRKRPPFLNLCLADGWARGGRPGPHQPKKIYEMLQSDSKKQKKRTPFLKLRLGDQSKQTKICYRIVYFSYFKCFRLLLKSKGNLRLLSNFV